MKNLTISMPVQVYGDPAEAVERSAQWRPGDPFPLLAGAALDRFSRLVGELPAVEVTPRTGTVFSTGGPVSRAAGRLLAVATERPHRHVDPAGLASAVAGAGPVALVGLASDLAEVGDWPAAGNPRVGVLTGRTPASLLCLVYRTLVPEAGARNGTFVVSNPFHQDELDADAIEKAEMDRLFTERNQLVVYHLHGRECSAGMPDAVICGRSHDGSDLPAPPPEGFRIPSCLRGEGCYRGDLAEEQRIRAMDLNAVLVFSQSCSTVAVGTSAFPSEVSLGAGFLEGTTVAVIGGMGSHMAEPGLEREVLDGVAAGLPLGDIVARLNSGDRGHRGGMATFGLLGDPGLVLTVPAEQEAPPPSPAPERSTAGGGEDAALETLRHLNDVVLPRCERLPWLELDGAEEEFLALRGRLRELAYRPADGDTAARAALLADEVAEAQHRLIRRAAASAQREGADFLGDSSSLFDQEAREEIHCVGCDRPRAFRLRLRHRVEQGLTVLTEQCRRCGDLHWSTAESPDTAPRILGPVDFPADRGIVSELTRELVNPGPHTVRGAVGFAFQTKDEPVLPSWVSEPVEIPAGGVYRFRIPLDLPAFPTVRPDPHTGQVMALLDGVYLLSPAVMNLA
ncbi:hypothetical protein C5F59_033635 [Streptomyces sp. QL37]|uniref:hypothetical protein n=1 Tax=Streptomyces sp. QL37 TaxID=2093747 RepID=UPI000CF26AF4|nr:hypothetical protein [Streptomyces sp. QL37]PPQ61157.1 hypothetical protein C5F59_34135 [Streptomyces sp. QL37]